MRAFVLLLCALFGVGCASTANYRPPVDLPGNPALEAGVGVDVGANLDAIAPGAIAWAAFRTEPGFDIFAAGRANPAVTFDDGLYAGVAAGGQAGIRYRLQQNFLEDMRFGAEIYGDYYQLDYTFNQDVGTPATRRFITGVIRLPVAQRAFEGVWVYTAPTVGLSVPLHDNPTAPFFGIQEMPIGIVWTPLDWMSLVVEGGFQITLQGGYGGVAVMFHL